MRQNGIDEPANSTVSGRWMLLPRAGRSVFLCGRCCVATTLGFRVALLRPHGGTIPWGKNRLKEVMATYQNFVVEYIG